MKDTFSTYNPFVNLIYFIFVICVSIFVMHPAVLTISFICAFIYSIKLNGIKAVKFNVKYMIPLLIISSVINPLFVHEGATILTYFKSGNPLTLESIIYGIFSSLMMVSVIMWFSCFNAIMTSDKIIYMFGRIIPGMSLILSMILRFVPRYKAQIKVISGAQKCIGRDVTNGNIIQRAKNGLKIMSIMLTWALENGVDTADSMNARGYGLRGRTSYSNIRFDSRDKIVSLIVILLICAVFTGIFNNFLYIRFYPTIKITGINLKNLYVYISYGIICILPVIIDIREDIKWKYLKSQI